MIPINVSGDSPCIGLRILFITVLILLTIHFLFANFARLLENNERYYASLLT